MTNLPVTPHDSSPAAFPTGSASRQGHLRHWIFGAVCLMLAAITVLGFNQSASAENGSVPPGGTIPPDLLATVTVIHAAPFSSNLVDTQIEICTETGVPVIGPLIFGDSVVEQFLPGTYDWKVTEGGSNCGTLVVDIAPFTLLNGSNKILIVLGDDDNQPIQAFVIATVAGAGNLYLPLARLNAPG